MEILQILVVAVLIGLIPAFIAQGKGRSFIGFWIYGALLFIVALPHALIMKADAKSIEETTIASGGRKCPYCAEIVEAGWLIDSIPVVASSFAGQPIDSLIGRDIIDRGLLVYNGHAGHFTLAY